MNPVQGPQGIKINTYSPEEAELEAQAIANIRKRRREALQRKRKLQKRFILVGTLLIFVLLLVMCHGVGGKDKPEPAQPSGTTDPSETAEPAESAGQPDTTEAAEPSGETPEEGQPAEQPGSEANAGESASPIEVALGALPGNFDGTLEDGTHIFMTKKGFFVIQKDGITRINGIIIANKTYSVPEDYGDGLTEEAEAAFDEMAAAAYEDGIVLYIASGYRSYNTQASLFNRYVGQDGFLEAERYSARPGHSEHQLGEAMDLNLVDESFANTPEGKWCNQHCHEYGFILRYPPGKEPETGYMQEPWHFRYVGKELAAVLYNGGDWITIEEYFGIDSIYDDEREV